MAPRGLSARGTLPVSIADQMASGRFRVVGRDATEVLTEKPGPGGDATQPSPLANDVPTDGQRLGAVAQVKPHAAVARVPERASSTAELSEGANFRGYRVARPFAEGGLSVLYEATSARHARPLLIKLLKPAYRRPETASVQVKLLAEGHLLRAANAAGFNRHLVPCVDVGMDERLGPFIVIEKLAGRSLWDELLAQLGKGTTFEPVAAVKVGVTVCEVLHQMHLLGAVHRDIKPANLFLAEEGGKVDRVVVLDWGAAKSPYTPETAQDSDTLGTIAYMAPELITRAGAITGAVDQYALGFVLLEMMHRHPFRAKAEVNTFTLMNAHLAETVEQPPTAFVPPRLWEVLRPAFEKDLAARYPSCAAFAQALRGWLENPDARADHKRALTEKQMLPTMPKRGPAKAGREPLRPVVDVAAKAPRLAMSESSEHASIVVRSGPQAGERYLAVGSLVIGRHEHHCNVVLHDPGVSQRHARLEGVTYGAGVVFTLIDLDSQNGTSVGGVRLSSGSDDDADDHLPPAGVLTGGSTFVLDTIELALMPPGRLGPHGAWQTPAEAKAEDDARARAGDRGGAQGGAARTVLDLRPTAPTLEQAHRFEPTMNLLVPSLLVTQERDVARYMLGVTGVIGSSRERANITLSDPRISGAHCRFTRTSAGVGGDVVYLFEDLGSTNGMWSGAGAERKQVRSVALRSGERVHLGRSVEVTLLAPGRFDDAWSFHLSDERGRPLVEEAAPASERPSERKGLSWRTAGVVAALTIALSGALVFALLQAGILRVGGAP